MKVGGTRLLPFERAWLELQISERGLLEEWMWELEILKKRATHVKALNPDHLRAKAEKVYGVDFWS